MNDEKTAIKRCLKGEKDEYRQIVELYQRQAVVHAVAIIGNREDALDAVQEAFMDAYRSLERFDTSRRFYPWFYVLLRNRCFKLAARKRETDSIEETEIISRQSNLPNEERIALETALLALKKEDREIITLKYLDGFSYQEISEHLQIPRGTVMSRLFYARKQLQVILNKKYGKET